MPEAEHYNNMDRNERNHLLKRLLENEGIVVFPSEKHTSVDGLPIFSILFNDLKEVLKEKEEKLRE